MMMLLRWRIYGNILFVHSFDLGHIFWISKIDLSQAKSFFKCPFYLEVDLAWENEKAIQQATEKSTGICYLL